MTKERAIQLKAAAERALQANYQLAAGLKPAHQGEWSTEPEKTANSTYFRDTHSTLTHDHRENGL